MRTRTTPGGAGLVFSLAAVLALSTPIASAQGVRLDPVRDGVAFGISLGFAGMSELILRFAPPPKIPGPTPVEALEQLDRSLMFPYSRQADVASTVFEYASMLMPLAVAAIQDPEGFLAAGAAYAEVFGVALGVKDLLKFLLPRYRPYTYAGGAPGADSSEDLWSFPSGHATMAFTAAAFSTYLFLQYLPGSAPMVPLVVLNYSLAGLAASYRVLSGMHFLSDIIAGAAIGTFCGFLLPSLIRQPGRP